MVNSTPTYFVEVGVLLLILDRITVKITRREST